MDEDARMGELTTSHFRSFDGTKLAVHRMGEGRPVLLLHGLFSSADMNWIKWGHTERLAEAGFEALMLDFRVHGDSESPRDPEAYNVRGSAYGRAGQFDKALDDVFRMGNWLGQHIAHERDNCWLHINFG